MNEQGKIRSENHRISRTKSRFAFPRPQENSKSRLLHRREKIADLNETREIGAFFTLGRNMPGAENRQEFGPAPPRRSHPENVHFSKTVDQLHCLIPNP
jgi:hypothetical protein